MNNKEYREYYTRRKQKKGTLDGFNVDNWEEVPDEALWEDGNLIFAKLFTGKWKLIREIK